MINQPNYTDPLKTQHDITAPSKKYKKQIVIASLAILLFVALYFGLASWFLVKAYYLFANTFTGGRDSGLSFVIALFMTFFGVFMFKAIFFLSKKSRLEDTEIKREDQPELFDFIYKVADEAKAPRPHKIFLSNTVNACVFYDISIINLFFPTRKNLEIGLGLVNVLNLGEFKSILAHEFGHFTQRSMIIGRWVYIAHQVVYQIVSKRDAFDHFIKGLSRIDIRIVWIGWILSIIVWSIRSFAEIFFKIVILTQRALSREMEFNADLVAVSINGSDALISSLYKLNAAEEAFDSAFTFVNKQLKEKRKTTDLFAIQANYITNMRVVLNNPEYGATPKQNTFSGQSATVFKEQIAQTPKMWNTHPSNFDREKNAKRIYIHSNIDERSAWVVFKNADKVKEDFTLRIFKADIKEAIPMSREESLKVQNKEFQRSFLQPKYRGIYLDRYVMLSVKYVNDIYFTPLDYINPKDKFAELYPEEIKGQLEQLKKLDEEVFMLEGLNKKVLTANEGKIRHRGREISWKELPSIIESVKNEEELIRNKIDNHVKLCRNVYFQAAKNIGTGWGNYLMSLTSVVHYCEHSQKNIQDLTKFFYDNVAEISAVRNVSSSQMMVLNRAGNELHTALKDVYTKTGAFKLSPALKEKLNGKEFGELLEEFKLGEANSKNINSWINVVHQWVNLAIDALNTLRLAALDELLQSEAYIEEVTLTNSSNINTAPEPVVIPTSYVTYDPKSERIVEKQVDWYSKFQNADGLFSAIAKFSVAASIILIAVFFARNVGNSRMYIYNGFPQDVIVSVNNSNYKVCHGAAKEVKINHESVLDIETKTLDGKELESFKQKLDAYTRCYIYNVANAAVLYSYDIYYGYSSPVEHHTMYGAKRWLDVDADDYFTDPPRSLSLKEGETKVRTVLTELKADPTQLIDLIKDEDERNNYIKNHILWEDANSPNLLVWLSISQSLKNGNEMLNKRLEKYPLDIATLRIQQDNAKGDTKKKICEQQNKLFLQNPNNHDLYYLNCRCIENDAEKDKAFIEANKKWPDNIWLAYASGVAYVENEEWENALSRFEMVFQNSNSMKIILGDEICRINRLLGKNNNISNDDDKQSYLSFVNNVENSYELNSDNKYYAFKLLSQGKLDEAITFIEPDTTFNGDIIRLAAVSDGASKEIIEKAKALPKNKYINSLTLMPALAFAIKMNLPYTEIKDEIVREYAATSDTIYKFIDCIKRNKINEAEKYIRTMSAEQKGKMSLLGVLVLGANAPAKWKVYADKLLFITEKPFLKMFTVLKNKKN